MRQIRIPAVFMRGGTSNALMFLERDLPEDRALWPALFRAAIGSPDPNGRQLNGMGGGVSSLSKVCVIGPPSREDADVDYTFAQIGIRNDMVDFGPNCGNMSSAVGPFAVDTGLVTATGAETLVRIHNTNTNKLIHASFALEDGEAAVEGDWTLAGVAGTGAPVRLSFLDPGGADTGHLLPTGAVAEILEVPGLGAIEVSIVDAAAATVILEASSIGLVGTELPEALEADAKTLNVLAGIRCAAAARIGLFPDYATAQKEIGSVPRIAFVSPAAAATVLTSETVPATAGDVTARVISTGDPHRALPLTNAMCLAAAARIEGTLIHRNTRPSADSTDPVRLMHPSGVLEAAAEVIRDEDATREEGAEAWRVSGVSVLRTQRRLFEGSVCVPVRAAPELADLALAAE